MQANLNKSNKVSPRTLAQLQYRLRWGIQSVKVMKCPCSCSSSEDKDSHLTLTKEINPDTNVNVANRYFNSLRFITWPLIKARRSWNIAWDQLNDQRCRVYNWFGVSCRFRRLTKTPRAPCYSLCFALLFSGHNWLKNETWYLIQNQQLYFRTKSKISN